MSFDVVRSVNIFPIKSCRAATRGGEVIRELQVSQTGFELDGVADRQWVISDEQGLFVSQRGWDKNEARKYPEDGVLATVELAILPEHLHVSKEGFGELVIPTDSESKSSSNTTIHGREVNGFYEGAESEAFFSQLLGRAVKLVRTDRQNPSMIPEKYQREGASNRSLAADGLPFLLTS